MDSSSSSSSPEIRPKNWLQHSKSYKFLHILGEGGFGIVIEGVTRDTQQTVAIKIAKHHNDLRQEANMLKVLMRHNMDKFNVIKFYDEFCMNSRIGLVFEMLDISLQEYLLDLGGPMRLEDIRTVIQQMATSFNALKRIGVIHTDVKLDNIMMVDQARQPFKVKLIDFGLAIFRSQAKVGRVHQTPSFRAPEIILGLPFSEAIDIWSLGCVMAVMIFGFILFPGRTDYDTLRFMIDLLGLPPDHLINAGRKSSAFLEKADSQWRLKSPEEYWGPTSYSLDNRFYSFRSLDEVKMMQLEEDNVTETEERWECFELLKAMFKWDASERITPSGILNHPFITKSYLNSSSHLTCCNEDLEAEAEPSTSQTVTKTKETIKKIQFDDSTSETLSAGVIMVRPANPIKKILLEETTDWDCEINSSPDTALNTTSIHPEETELTPTTIDDSKAKKKKKKKCFKHFFSWMKRTFCSCCYVDNVKE